MRMRVCVRVRVRARARDQRACVVLLARCCARCQQFGHVVLFAAVFPLGAIFAIVNNLVEQRSDSFKILFECQRPLPVSARGIGGWVRALQFVSYVSIITNSALLYQLLRDDGGVRAMLPHSSPCQLLLSFVAIEHAIVALKLCIGEIVPKVSHRVATLRRQQWRILSSNMRHRASRRASELLTRVSSGMQLRGALPRRQPPQRSQQPQQQPPPPQPQQQRRRMPLANSHSDWPV